MCIRDRCSVEITCCTSRRWYSIFVISRDTQVGHLLRLVKLWQCGARRLVFPTTSRRSRLFMSHGKGEGDVSKFFYVQSLKKREVYFYFWKMDGHIYSGRVCSERIRVYWPLLLQQLLGECQYSVSAYNTLLASTRSHSRHARHVRRANTTHTQNSIYICL